MWIHSEKRTGHDKNIQSVRVLSSRMYLQPNNATKRTLTCCLLQKILRTVSKNSYSLHGFADDIEENGSIRSGEWRNGLHSVMRPLAATTSRHTSRDAESIRNIFREYLYGRGQVSWQWKHIN